MRQGARTRMDTGGGWAVRNAVGQVVVIFEGHDAQAAADEWASGRRYTVQAVSVD
ncbi:MAG: hypothetical protein QOK43_178 [Acidimicrobiaceae bacterium]|jgi:hypothetical protein|nr:hypothetical protein [Acidimicrobiaceae bacterium]MDQ1444198.1 hypothetical protein [Acidimicrobiaceae bacterium]